MAIKPSYQKIFQNAKPFLRTRKNVIHTQIALRYALQLLKSEKGDERIVIPAIILHDVGWSAVPEHLHLTAFGPKVTNPKLTRVHEIEGAKIAQRVLERFKYPPGKIKEICQIIRGHDSRKRPLSWNDRMVKDSDKLWRYSRRGMTIDLSRFHIPRKKYLVFLETIIDDWFHTPMAAKIAREEILLRKKDKPSAIEGT